jgi:hypothetical protein
MVPEILRVAGLTGLGACMAREKISSGNMDLPTMYNLVYWSTIALGCLNRFERETQSRYRSDRKVTFVVAIGINDSRMVAEFEHANVETYVRNLAEISSIARSYSSRIMFIGLTPCVESRTNPLPWVDERAIRMSVSSFLIRRLRPSVLIVDVST